MACIVSQEKLVVLLRVVSLHIIWLFSLIVFTIFPLFFVSKSWNTVCMCDSSFLGITSWLYRLFLWTLGTFQQMLFYQVFLLSNSLFFFWNWLAFLIFTLFLMSLMNFMNVLILFIYLHQFGYFLLIYLLVVQPFLKHSQSFPNIIYCVFSLYNIHFVLLSSIFLLRYNLNTVKCTDLTWKISVVLTRKGIHPYKPQVIQILNISVTPENLLCALSQLILSTLSLTSTTKSNHSNDLSYHRYIHWRWYSFIGMILV